MEGLVNVVSYFFFKQRKHFLFPEKRQFESFHVEKMVFACLLACLVRLVSWFLRLFFFPNFLNFSLLNSSVEWDGTHIGKNRQATSKHKEPKI